jgi:hypothetical protein
VISTCPLITRQRIELLQGREPLFGATALNRYAIIRCGRGLNAGVVTSL